MTDTRERPDLSVFDADNKRWKRKNRRVSLDERRELVEDRFPCVKLDGEEIFARDDVLFAVLRSIYTIGEVTGRSELSWEDAIRVHRELGGDEYTELPFGQAFERLAKARQNSMSAVARKTGIPKTKVFRLMREQDKPEVHEIVTVASAYNKLPEYFLEYRVEYIVATVTSRLMQMAPETTYGIFRKVQGYEHA